MSVRRQRVVGACAALLAACATQQEAPISPPVPAAFDHGSTQARWPSRQWYREFGSSELDALVDSAVSGNFDLLGARARIAQADARARQAGAPLLPSVDANGNGNYLAGHSSQGGGHELDWAAMLSASYEVDFWGKQRAAAQSAAQLAAASRADRDTIEVSTLAGIAEVYFQLLALRERLAVARENRQAAAHLLAVVQARFDAGVAGPIELATQKTELDGAAIAISELQQAADEARTALAMLLGRAPQGFDVAGQPLDSLQEPRVAAGLPSELLARRPDVLLAEANLRAGHGDLLAARAAMFPSLSLTAGGGIQNPALPATVLTIPGVGPSLALGADLVQPIFDHGLLAARRDEARAKENELISAYRAAIVAALGDVENALAAIQRLDEARNHQSENAEQSERAFTGAQLRYQAGSVDFLTLLESQRTLYAARDRYIQYKLARLQALVGLCKALGGGWTQQQPDAGAATRPGSGSP